MKSITQKFTAKKQPIQGINKQKKFIRKEKYEIKKKTPTQIGLEATSRTIGLLNLMMEFVWCGQFTEKIQHSAMDREGILGCDSCHAALIVKSPVNLYHT